MLKNLGSRIRKLRKEKGLTLVEVSEQTQIAQATLSRIETSGMSGTIESHERIAEVLGVGLPELYFGVDRRFEKLSHQSKEAERKVTFHSKSVHIELLTQESSKKKITPLLITLQSHAKTVREQQTRGVEKFLYVLQGEVEAKVERDTFTLKPGETLYFDASHPHVLTNLKSSEAVILCTVSPSKI